MLSSKARRSIGASGGGAAGPRATPSFTATTGSHRDAAKFADRAAAGGDRGEPVRPALGEAASCQSTDPGPPNLRPVQPVDEPEKHAPWSPNKPPTP
jgi:hypothetical protein